MKEGAILHSNQDSTISSTVKANRKDRIYKELKSLTVMQLDKKITEGEEIGITTDYISRRLDIDRSNVSRELNELIREEKVIKICSKPVYYLEKNALEEFAKIRIKSVVISSKSELRMILQNKRPQTQVSEIHKIDGSIKKDTHGNNQMKNAGEYNRKDFSDL
jgi:hypothetical protein